MRQGFHAPRRRGVAVLYVIVAMVAFMGIVSLAVDVAHVRVVKIELQQAADAGAYAAALNIPNGQSTAQAQAIYAARTNTADATTVVLASTDITCGNWNATTRTFTPLGAWSISANAVRVTARRTAATSNPVRLTFANIVGLASSDVVATSIGVLTPASSQTVTINGTDDPWLAGMPNGSTASYDDTAPAEDPVQVTGINVTPGSMVTLTNISGAVNHDPSLAKDGPDGNTSQIYSHGADSPGGPTPATENGIGDILAPIDGLLGVFLGAQQPNLGTPPTSRLDYSTAASRDEPTYTDIQLQQPFFIGNGITTSGVVQQFQVPAHATRLFLGPMDGHEWKNNGGSFVATVSNPASVQIVQ